MDPKETELLVALQQQYEQMRGSFDAMTKSITPLVETLQKATKKEEEMTTKLRKEEDEQKMFKRFMKLLKDEGAVFARKEVPGAHSTQTSVKPVIAPAGQQEVIQGQEDEEEKPEEEYPEVKAAVPPELKPEEKKACVEPKEDKKAPNLTPEAENKALKDELATVKASIPDLVSKAFEKKMQEIGWKSVGHTPVKMVGTEQVSLFKGDKPVDKEELIKTLKNKPLAELNDMRFSVLAGTLRMPVIKEGS